jgi:hypothetical protein
MEVTYFHLVNFKSMFQDCGGKKIVHMGDQVGINDGDDRLLGTDWRGTFGGSCLERRRLLCEW